MHKLIFVIITLTLGATSNNSMDDTYDALWKEVSAYENKNLPKSAYEIVEKIYTKSKQEKRDDQLIKAIIYKYKLKGAFEDYDPASYIEQIESERANLNSEAGKAIMASILGEQYHSYAINNMHRFGNRTEVREEEQGNSAISRMSLEVIQKKSIEWYRSSLEYKDEDGIKDYISILQAVDNQTSILLKAKNVREFILFRTIRHFSNSSSFVSLPTQAYKMSDAELFRPLADFVKLDIVTTDIDNHKYVSLKLYQEALSINSLDENTRRLLDVKRIEYLNNFSEIKDKTQLYTEYLERIANSNIMGSAGQYAYVKLIKHYMSRGQMYRNNNSAEYENDYGIAYTYIQNAKKKYPKGEYLHLIKKLQKELNHKYLTITAERVNVSEQDFLIKVEYRNIANAKLRLVSLTDKEKEKLKNTRQNEDRILFLRSLNSIESWQEGLPDSDDFNQHTTELAVSGLQYGTYALLISNNQKMEFGDNKIVSVATFDVSDISYTYTDGKESSYGYVMDRTSGEPMSGVTIEVYKHVYNNRKRNEELQLLETVISDKKGRFSYNQDERNFSFVFKNGNDVLDLSFRHYHYNNYRNINQDIVNLYTDRSIYRPGQRVYYKGLSLEKSSGSQISKIKDGDSGTVFLRDANYQVVEEQSYKANEYGTFSGSILLPEDVLTGNFSLMVENRGYLNIKVEEYKRPKIYSEFLPLEKPYVLGDTVELTGVLKSFSGASNEGASVSYRVTRTAYFDYYKYSYHRRMPHSNQSAELMASGEIVTDKDGEFVINFPTYEQNEKSYLRYNYSVECDITDITGESTQASKMIGLSTSPFTIKADIPERSFLSDIEDIELNVLNVESKELEADITIDVFDLKYSDKVSRKSYWREVERPSIDSAELLRRFPLDAGYQDNYSKLKVKSKLVSKDLKSGESWSQLKELKPGLYKVVIKATDLYGNSDDLIKYVALSDDDSKAVAVHNFWVSELQSSYEPGDNLEVKVNSPYDSYKVLYRITQQQETISEGWLVQKNNKLKHKIKESDRGNVSIELLMVHDNRLYKEQLTVVVPWTNKDLDIVVESFRDKIIPGSEEEYTVKIKDSEGQLQDAEILASIYDASLDQFTKADWVHNIYPIYHAYYLFNKIGFGIGDTYTSRTYYNYNTNTQIQFSPNLNLFGLNLSRGNRHYDAVTMTESAMDASPMMRKSASRAQNEVVEFDNYSVGQGASMDQNLGSNEHPINIPAREILNETVFFYPEVLSDNGTAKISFTMNEALTKWKLRLMAHTKDLKVGYVEKSIITQKNLMIEPHLPRYVRQGDDIIINAKVTNLSEELMNVNSQLMITDAISNENLNTTFGVSKQKDELSLAPGESKTVEFAVVVPEDFYTAIIVKMVADGGQYKDGEQSILPVLSNRKLVTESTVFHIPSNSDNEFSVSPLLKIEESTTLDPYNYTIEVSSNPAWIIAKSIPYLLDADMTSTDNLFGSLYGTLLGRHLVQSNPDIKDVIKKWDQTNANKSTLSKNSDLKISGIELTPWLRDAQAEEYNMKRLSFLVDDNNVAQAINNLRKKLQKRQLSNGGFVWTNGAIDHWYITQQVLEGVGHLQKLGIDMAIIDQEMIAKANQYIDDRFMEYHKKNKSGNKKYINETVIHYLYTKSFFSDIKSEGNVMKAQNYYFEILNEAWKTQNTYMQAMICLTAYKSGKKELADKIYKSLNERMVVDAEIGNYWNDMAGYYWYNPTIEKHALLIELYEDKNAPQDVIDGLKLWLLKNKQTNAWNTSKATTAAVYAFMIGADDWLSGSEPIEVLLPITNERVQFDNIEYATGYGRTDYPKSKITSKMSKVKIKNPNNHIAWGAAYFQYWEELNSITTYEDTPLQLSKIVYKVGMEDNGEVLDKITTQDKINVGDKLRIRIELSVDRPMEFIQMRDMRSSGVEPYNVLSQYKWQDGLGYYESTKDVATFFYFDYLPKGDFVFEYDVYASHRGQYSNGITEIQSMYAPEFSSHSEGVSIIVE